MTQPGTLYVVACACPLTRHIDRLLKAATDAGWKPVIAATPDGMGWLPLDADGVTPSVAGVPVVSQHRHPNESKRLPPPDAAIVLATANTLAKMRVGIADTYAHALLCEVISARTPLVVVPSISSRLGGHPAYGDTIDWLRDFGAVVVDPRDGDAAAWKPLDSGTGESVAASVDWSSVLTLLSRRSG